MDGEHTAETLDDRIRALPRLSRTFYERRALDLAPLLLGMVMAHDSPQGLAAGRIIETEAYEAPEDRACHAFGGRRTKRNEVMYGPPGHAYVYFTYGMHWMLNIVAGPSGTPHAVLIRSVEPICGIDLMTQRRGGVLPLAEGPARLCQALQISKADNGLDLVASRLFVAKPPESLDSRPEYLVTKRVGVGNSGEAKHYPWRFVVRGTAPARMKVEYD